MTGGGWRFGVGLLVLPAAVAGLAGCGGGGGHPAAASSAKAAAAGGITAAMLKGALLTRVNGVAAAGPASSGEYASVSAASVAGAGAGGGKVSPAACGRSTAEGLDPAALASAPAAAVTFQVGKNGVSEVLIASSGKSAAAALAGHVPAGCARYQEKAEGKTVTYGVTEQPVAGVGAQAKALDVHAAGSSSDDRWSLIYRGTNFVGTVTVAGPNASEKAVQELGQQAYAFAAKTLS